MTHRFFVPAEWLRSDPIEITGGLAHQIADVLRLRPGEQIVLLDNSGWEYRVELIRVASLQARGILRGKSLATREPRTKITLYQALLKGDHFEYVLQKGTELGVIEFVPLICDRCVVATMSQASAKLARYQRIILEAAEQCGRAKFPALRPAILFRQACEQNAGRGLSLIPWEGERVQSLKGIIGERAASASKEAREGQGSVSRPGLRPRPFSVSLFIGPEGGFCPEEVSWAQRYGIVPVSLGPRILRAETAGLAATAAILYEFGDLGG